MENYLEITTPKQSYDAKMFTSILNQPMDLSQEGFTKSKFHYKQDEFHVRLVLNFHHTELPLLIRRLDEQGTDNSMDFSNAIRDYIKENDIDTEEIPCMGDFDENGDTI
jgi:hypothetical protein